VSHGLETAIDKGKDGVVCVTMSPRRNEMMKRRLLFVIILLLFSSNLTFCGKAEKSQSTPTAGTGNASKVNATSVPKSDTIRFKTFSCIDKEGIGMETFRILMPSDWQFEGGVKWLLKNPAMPAVVDFRIHNPKGKEEFQVFPNQTFFWTNNQMVLANFPVGSQYLGNEICPPLAGPIESLKKIVLPRFRRDVTDLKVTKEELLPDLAKQLGAGGGMQNQPGMTSSADAAKIRIQYKQNDSSLEEEIYSVVETYTFSVPTMAGTITNIYWLVDYIFSFKAEKGKLEDNAKTFLAIVYSFKPNQQWFNKYNQVVNYLAQQQIQQIQNIGQISRIISQTNNEISDMIMKSYNQRQAVNDRIASNFSQAIRGVDEYYNPIEQKAVELPTGYRNAWTNSQGEYILSDDPNFNPNINSNLNWQRIDKK